MDDANRKTSAAPPLSSSAISALHHGDKIVAIKIVREERNIGLKEAKDAVEDYVRRQPTLQSSFAAAQAETKRTALRWLAMLIGLAILAYYFLAKPRAMAMRSNFSWCGRAGSGVPFSAPPRPAAQQDAGRAETRFTHDEEGTQVFERRGSTQRSLDLWPNESTENPGLWQRVGWA